MKKHICDVCKLNEVHANSGELYASKGSLHSNYMLDECANSPIPIKILISVNLIQGMFVPEDICKSCLKTILLEAIGEQRDG